IAAISGAETPPLVLGLETARGIVAATRLAEIDAPLLAVYFGAEDLITDVGGRRTAAGQEVLFARSRVLLAARAAGIRALDQALPDVRDDELFVSDAAAGRNLGYDGKLCIHPRQVELANAAFTPSE